MDNHEPENSIRMVVSGLFVALSIALSAYVRYGSIQGFGVRLSFVVPVIVAGVLWAGYRVYEERFRISSERCYFHRAPTSPASR